MKAFHQIILLFSISMLWSCKPKVTRIPAIKTFENNLVFPDTTYTIELTYSGMGCPCPQWITNKNLKIYNSKIGEIPTDSLFVDIVAAEGYEQNPFELAAWEKKNGSSNTFIFEGRLSTNKFKWQSEDGIIWENKVFQYSNCKFIDKEVLSE